jgi:hypothetical protein
MGATIQRILRQLLGIERELRRLTERVEKLEARKVDVLHSENRD